MSVSSLRMADCQRSCRTARSMNRSQETRLKKLRAKLEQARGACPRRYCFHFDEVAEAEAQGLPYVLVPRTLSLEEWEKEYSIKPQGRGEEVRTAGAGEREKK
jgi:hypothetical protein